MNKFVPQGKVKEITGSILSPENAGLRMIISACSQNDKYKSAHFDMLKKRWIKVAQDYREWYVGERMMKLGNTNQSFVSSDICIMQMVCLDKEGALNAEALALCIKNLIAAAKYEHATLHISTMLVQEVPELKKALEALPAEGLNLNFYQEAQVAIKR